MKLPRSARSPHDSYPTPRWVLRRFLDRVPLSGNWLEPAVGDGNLVAEAEAHMHARVRWHGCDVQESLLARERLGEAHYRVGDFLAESPPWGGPYDGVLTNPPFELAMPFLRRSLTLAPQVVLLLRLDWLGSASRNAFLRTNMPDVYVVPDMPSFTPDGKSDSYFYAWFVWYRQPPGCVRRVGTTQVLDTTPKAGRD